MKDKVISFEKWSTVELRLQIEELEKEDKEYLSNYEKEWLRKAKIEMEERENKKIEII